MSTSINLSSNFETVSVANITTATPTDVRLKQTITLIVVPSLIATSVIIALGLIILFHILRLKKRRKVKPTFASPYANVHENVDLILGHSTTENQPVKSCPTNFVLEKTITETKKSQQRCSTNLCEEKKYEPFVPPTLVHVEMSCGQSRRNNNCHIQQSQQHDNDRRFLTPLSGSQDRRLPFDFIPHWPTHTGRCCSTNQLQNNIASFWRPHMSRTTRSDNFTKMYETHPRQNLNDQTFSIDTSSDTRYINNVQSAISGTRCLSSDRECKICRHNSVTSSLIPNLGSLKCPDRTRIHCQRGFQNQHARIIIPNVQSPYPQQTVESDNGSSDSSGEEVDLLEIKSSRSRSCTNASTIKSAPPTFGKNFSSLASTTLKRGMLDAFQPENIRPFSNSNCFPSDWDYEPGGLRYYEDYKRKLKNLKRTQDCQNWVRTNNSHYGRRCYDFPESRNPGNHSSNYELPNKIIKRKPFKLVYIKYGERTWAFIKYRLNSSMRIVPAEYLLDTISSTSTNSCTSVTCSCDSSSCSECKCCSNPDLHRTTGNNRKFNFESRQNRKLLNRQSAMRLPNKSRYLHSRRSSTGTTGQQTFEDNKVEIQKKYVTDEMNRDDRLNSECVYHSIGA